MRTLWSILKSLLLGAGALAILVGIVAGMFTWEKFAIGVAITYVVLLAGLIGYGIRLIVRLGIKIPYNGHAKKDLTNDSEV